MSQIHALEEYLAYTVKTNKCACIKSVLSLSWLQYVSIGCCDHHHHQGSFTIVPRIQ